MMRLNRTTLFFFFLSLLVARTSIHTSGNNTKARQKVIKYAKDTNRLWKKARKERSPNAEPSYRGQWQNADTKMRKWQARGGGVTPASYKGWSQIQTALGQAKTKRGNSLEKQAKRIARILKTVSMSPEKSARLIAGHKKIAVQAAQFGKTVPPVTSIKKYDAKQAEKDKSKINSERAKHKQDKKNGVTKKTTTEKIKDGAKKAGEAVASGAAKTAKNLKDGAKKKLAARSEKKATAKVKKAEKKDKAKEALKNKDFKKEKKDLLQKVKEGKLKKDEYKLLQKENKKDKNKTKRNQGGIAGAWNKLKYNKKGKKRIGGGDDDDGPRSGGGGGGGMGMMGGMGMQDPSMMAGMGAGGAAGGATAAALGVGLAAANTQGIEAELEARAEEAGDKNSIQVDFSDVSNAFDDFEVQTFDAPEGDLTDFDNAQEEESLTFDDDEYSYDDYYPEELGDTQTSDDTPDADEENTDFYDSYYGDY